MSFGLKAEYDGFHIHFKIETKTGGHLQGYISISPHYFNTDSLESTSYLVQLFDRHKMHGEADSFWFFQDKILMRNNPSFNKESMGNICWIQKL